MKKNILLLLIAGVFFATSVYSAQITLDTTPSTGNSSTQQKMATTVNSNFDEVYTEKAPLADPTFTGEVTVGTGGIQFDTSGTPPAAYSPGLLYWNVDDATLNIDTGESDSTLQVNQESVVPAKNGTAVTITDGQVVYISGAATDRPTIDLADADVSVTTSRTIGVATTDINAGATGKVTTFGFVRGISTAGFTAGDLLWVSGTPGAFTNVMPSHPQHHMRIGYAITIDASNGVIFVSTQRGMHLENLWEVNLTSPSNGEVLTYNSTSTQWENAAGGGSPEGTAVLSTGETGGVKYLREDGDGTSSWQTPTGSGDMLKVTYDTDADDKVDVAEAVIADASANIVIKLGDAAGTNKLSITDSADAEVAKIDSDGGITSPKYYSSAVDGARYQSFPNNTAGNEPGHATVVNGFYSFENRMYMVENSVDGYPMVDTNDLLKLNTNTIMWEFNATELAATATAPAVGMSYRIPIPVDWDGSTYDSHNIVCDGLDETGAHDGLANAPVLTDSGETWTIDEFVGYVISNTTDVSSCTITANTATTVTCTLVGGTDNDWDIGDAYVIASSSPSMQITVGYSTTKYGTFTAYSSTLVEGSVNVSTWDAAHAVAAGDYVGAWINTASTGDSTACSVELTLVSN